MKSSYLNRYQTYRRRGGHKLSQTKTACRQRRYYWLGKLRAAGVPEDRLDATYEALMKLRLQQRVKHVYRDKYLVMCRDYYRRHKVKMCRKARERYAEAKREERSRATMSIGG